MIAGLKSRSLVVVEDLGMLPSKSGKQNHRHVRVKCEKCGIEKSCLLTWVKSQRAICRCDYRCSKIGVGVAAKNALLYTYRRNARTKHLSFELTDEQFFDLTKRNCAYCGQIPAQVFSQKGFNGVYVYNGVDRIKNKIGYNVANCVPCCHRCNMIKRHYDLQEFKEHVTKIFHHSCKESL